MSARPTGDGGQRFSFWEGRAARADRILVAGLVLSVVYPFALLPTVPALVGSHPLLLETLRGSMSSMITMGGLARTGHASLVLAVLAGAPAYLMFDWLYWWAGRRWGDRAMHRLLGRSPEQAERRSRRLRRSMDRFGPAAIVLAPYLPVPSALIYAAAGLGGMRLRTFLVLDLIAALLWAATMVALGYALGQHAVDVARAITHYALWITIAMIALLVLYHQLSARGGRDDGYAVP